MTVTVTNLLVSTLVLFVTPNDDSSPITIIILAIHSIANYNFSATADARIFQNGGKLASLFEICCHCSSPSSLYYTSLVSVLGWASERAALLLSCCCSRERSPFLGPFYTVCHVTETSIELTQSSMNPKEKRKKKSALKQIQLLNNRHWSKSSIGQALRYRYRSTSIFIKKYIYN